MAKFFGIDDELLAKKILPKALRGGVEPTLVNAFSASGVKNDKGGDIGSPMAVIHRRKIESGDGETYSIPMVRDLDPMSRVYDEDEVTGKESTLTFVSDSGIIRCIDTPLKLSYKEKIRLTTPTQIESYVLPSLRTAIQRAFEIDVWGQAMIKTIYTNLAANDDLSRPVYDRVVFSVAVGTAQPVRGTYDGQGFQTTLESYETPANNKLNCVTIDLAKLYAEQGGAEVDKEHMLHAPDTYISQGIRADEWILFIDPACEMQLDQDVAWTSQYSSARSPEYGNAPSAVSGSRYLGKRHGVRVFSNPYLSRFRISHHGHVHANNILCGAGALDLGIYKAPEMIFKDDDYKKQWGVTFREFRGQKAPRFPSKQKPNGKAEFGIIHVMSCIS